MSSPARRDHRRKQRNTIAIKGPPCRARPPQPPATVRSRLSGHPGRLWRLAAIARVPFEGSAVAVTFSVPMSSAGGTGLIGWSDRSGAQAGIEPAVDADVITYVGIARDVRDAPHPCIIGCERHPRPSRDSLRVGDEVRPKGDRRILGCNCVVANCPALAEPRVTAALRDRRRRDFPDALSITVASGGADAASVGTAGAATVPGAHQRAPERPEKRAREPRGQRGGHGHQPGWKSCSRYSGGVTRDRRERATRRTRS